MDKKRECVLNKEAESQSKLCSCLVWSIRVTVLSNYAGARMSLSFERCVLSCRGLCVRLITCLIPAECSVSECDREASIMRSLGLTRGCYFMRGEKYVVQIKYYLYINYQLDALIIIYS